MVQQPAERLNRENHRRTVVVGILPARDSLTRLVGDVVAQQHDEWTEQRRYIGLDVVATLRPMVVENTDNPEVIVTAYDAYPTWLHRDHQPRGHTGNRRTTPGNPRL